MLYCVYLLDSALTASVSVHCLSFPAEFTMIYRAVRLNKNTEMKDFCENHNHENNLRLKSNNSEKIASS